MLMCPGASGSRRGAGTTGAQFKSLLDVSARDNEHPSSSLGGLVGRVGSGDGGGSVTATAEGGAVTTPVAGSGAAAASSSAVGAGGGGGGSAEFSFGIGSEEWFMQMVSLGSTINK
eukprot:TRINITY_DN16666_c0_g1_i1.p2 TRINITY_DN16666_c0_g1~~TRINITY_DN16666_c0_g1_i1.p2  ORF type:complete len:116 (+),score=24.94 TRINITY_DN16666_c0_g1_i1:239-586(+)